MPVLVTDSRLCDVLTASMPASAEVEPPSERIGGNRGLG